MNSKGDNNKMSAIKRYLLGKGASEELLPMMTQNVSKRVVQALPLNRGQVAAQEQIKILREALANETEEQALPLNRGQVAAMEQVRVLREAVAGAIQEQAGAPPQNRGQVAAQEQFRIMREALGISYA